MSSIAQLRRDVQRYRVLKSQIGRIIPQLNNAADRAGDLDMEIRGSYQVNGDSAVMSSRATALRKKIDETARRLRSPVLPAIDSAIDEALREIARLEEEARRAAEAAEAARKAAEENK